MLKIYITNLGKYNEGFLVGEWVELPVSDEKLEEVKEHIGIDEQYEEYFITDYESDIEGLEIGEYEDIDTLNELAEELENMDEYEQKAAEAMLMEGYSYEDMLEKVEDGEYMYFSNCSDMEDVAREYIEETGLLSDVPSELQYYFDFEAYGRDMSYEGQFVFVGNDCIQIL